MRHSFLSDNTIPRRLKSKSGVKTSQSSHTAFGFGDVDANTENGVSRNSLHKALFTLNVFLHHFCHYLKVCISIVLFTHSVKNIRHR